MPRQTPLAPARTARAQVTLGGEVAPVERRPRRARARRARASSCCAGSVESTPIWAPPSRMRRTSARVSMPAMPGTPQRARNAGERLAARASCSAASKTSFTTKPGEARPLRLVVLGVDADVADLRVGHRDDLPGVRGIGEDLLVAGQAGVEAHLADADAARRRRRCRGRRCRRRARAARAGGAAALTAPPPRARRRTPARPADERDERAPTRQRLPAHGELRLFEKPLAGS